MPKVGDSAMMVETETPWVGRISLADHKDPKEWFELHKIIDYQL